MLSVIQAPGGGVRVIQLTRLNNARLAVNCDLIKYVEEAPDTVLTLLNGEKLVVRETTEQVIERVRDFRRSVLIAGPDNASPSGVRANSADEAPSTAEGPQRG
jgi:flagellar protein FlbD